ncbi:glucosylglycerol hydrolase [Halobellus rarus]|uniref:Glucosylglycerol hydrolase n=1 Tax=Halobellus rarus TaxID=1126237 RepID=A0ABD6CUN7_9EURY|nr:glucosylglycerol hydrolase [Halobellus rarus]
MNRDSAPDRRSDSPSCRSLDEPTAELLAWHRAVKSSHEDDFAAATELTTRLGAHLTDEGNAAVGFWTPDLVEAGVPESAVFLEILTPPEDLDPGVADAREVTFDRSLVSLERAGEYHWGVVDGMRPGTRERLGSLYRLTYRSEEGTVETVADPFAYSVPFGPFAPAEFYDIDRLDETRADRNYFEALGTDAERVATAEDDGLPRIEPATSMLEIHPGTATDRGSLAGLAAVYESIGEAQRGDGDLDAWQRNFVGYDALQLMPVEPLTESEDSHTFWRVEAATEGELRATVARPEPLNWGYDIVVSAFSAPNPGLLESGRPDELVDFIAACHRLPRPIKVVFDVALGHADDRGAELLADRFVLGPGMYGKHLDYTEPTARAAFLELQRRKMDFGADGIRVDGAQDFTSYDPETGEMYHDDEFLAEMDRVVQEVAGTEYRPWMIYEDGRPWPREDWELASSYRALTEQHPHAFQWSPVTFAHNTPALLTFWATKWWRVREIGEFGSRWITGVANHDTVRRGTQVDPTTAFTRSPINPYLGESHPETLEEAYDNAAASMLFHAFLPGVPMDFAHANMRAPWGFVRDTDDTWKVKVVAEEANFLHWQVRESDFADEAFFERVKSFGFESLSDLQTFMNALAAAVDVTDTDLDAAAAMLSVLDSPFGPSDGDLSPADLDAYADAWMRDVHEFSTLDHWRDEQGDRRIRLRLRTREFRQAREWLRGDLRDDEYFTYRHPTEGTVLYYGFRRAPPEADVDEELLFAANMEGVAVDVSPESLAADAAADANAPPIPTDGWEPALVAPGADGAGGPQSTVTLENATAVVWRRDP